MADSPDQVLTFLSDLAARAQPQAQRELDELRDFARVQYGIEPLEPWDISYYSEKLRQHRYQLSQEELRPYFPVTHVLPGLFAVAEKLFGLTIRPLPNVEVWHPDVQVYDISDAAGNPRGRFYLDLYARPHKRGGAWMDGCLGRRRINGQIRLPAAYLVCNFTPPVGNDPALLTHNEVVTMFHEFGHGLHHLLTQIDYLPVAGIHGVEWDAVELPSQFLENWCWSHDALTLLARHYQTGEPLPDALYQRMLAAKNFQAGLFMVRQLEFGLFDFRLHRDYDPARGGRVLDVLDSVRQQVAVIIPPAYNRFANGFTHIFAGGYAAGYYSYKWAEVLSADAFSAFEENGIFDPETGARFRDTILEVGGSRPALDSFIAFRGRKPQIEALLRLTGIAA
jgi:oligopeptidase A